MNNKLAVFYRPEQSVANNNSFSPSAGKPSLVVARYLKNPRVEVVTGWKPLREDDFNLAHSPAFVRGVFQGVIPNGFSNTSKDVSNSLPFTAGSFYNAAVYAWENNTVAMSPTSGFHHSGYSYCHGFCTFNGLMITAMLLMQRHGVRKVGIVDFDAHYGDGTANIIDEHGLHSHVEHMSFGFMAGVDKTMNFDLWLEDLEDELWSTVGDCDIWLYQAGADPHVDDPLGGALTTEQLKRRDEIVFRTAKKLNKPIVWNLAGGYQSPLYKVLDIHQNTLNACLEHYLL